MLNRIRLKYGQWWPLADITSHETREEFQESEFLCEKFVWNCVTNCKKIKTVGFTFDTRNSGGCILFYLFLSAAKTQWESVILCVSSMMMWINPREVFAPFSFLRSIWLLQVGTTIQNFHHHKLIHTCFNTISPHYVNAHTHTTDHICKYQNYHQLAFLLNARWT